jgi:molecular chaperone GrpE
MSRKHHHEQDDELPAGEATPPAPAAPPAPPAPPEPPPPPPPTAEELARLRARAAEADVLEDRLKRAQAEFVNESKRIARQAEQDRRFAVEQVAKDLVPLAEGLGSALAAAQSATAAQALKDGVALVAKQLEDILARYGIELLRPAGQAFDPASHEAILVVERSDVPPNHVADVIRPGFRLHGRVVRPAQVTVSKAPATPGAAGPAGA